MRLIVLLPPSWFETSQMEVPPKKCTAIRAQQLQCQNTNILLKIQVKQFEA